MSVAARRAVVHKMHGTHNEFVVLDERPARFERYSDIAIRFCAREGEGLAADGLLVVGDAPAGSPAFASMRVINADGSDAEMCGNGVRCVARYLAERGAPDRFDISTAAGVVGIDIVRRAPDFLVRVDMGFPHFADADTLRIEAAGREWDVHRVWVGNPHAVIFVDDPGAVDLETLGREVNVDPHFPGGVNTHVVRRVDASTLQVRHWERGVGLTQACGTGAVASAAVAIRAGLVSAPVQVRVPGGTLEIDWTPGRTATMTGPAENIFEREISL